MCLWKRREWKIFLCILTDRRYGEGAGYWKRYDAYRAGGGKFKAAWRGRAYCEYSEGYLEGENLVVTSGAMKNYRGTVKKVLRHKRLVVLEMPLMGRVVEVTVGLGIVKREPG